VLTPSQKGSIAECEIVAAAVKLGIPVFKPANEGLRYDLIFDLEGAFIRVQCKWAVRRGEMSLCHASAAGGARTVSSPGPSGEESTGPRSMNSAVH
jgi:PD-(D/E)XK nuclease superfamily protein